jgi:hypothetical protein
MIERDKCLYFKEGYKYWVNRPYHIKIEIHPKRNICLSFKTSDIYGNQVEIPLVTLDTKGNLIVYTAYVWDGASGPTWDTLNSMIGSLIHDVIYQLIRLGLIDDSYKTYADQLLHDLCTADGMWEFRADYWQWAVKEFGTGSCRPSAEHQEMIAP